MSESIEKLDYYALGLQLRKIRERLNLSQEYVADFLDVAPSTVYRFETGQRSPSLEMLHQFSILTNVSIDNIINPTRTEPDFIQEYNHLSPQKKRVVNETMGVLISSLSSNL